MTTVADGGRKNKHQGGEREHAWAREGEVQGGILEGGDRGTEVIIAEGKGSI